MLRTSTILILGCSPTIVRAFNRYLYLMKYMFHVCSNIDKLWLLLCYLCVPFRQLSPPPGFHVAHIPKGNLLLCFCVNVFFWHIGISSSSGHGSFPVLSARPMAHVISGVLNVVNVVRHYLVWQVPTGSDSEHVEPSRPMQTHAQVKRMSDRSCTS